MLISDKGCSIRVAFSIIHPTTLIQNEQQFIINVKNEETFFVFFVSDPKKQATFAPWMKRK